VRVRQGIGAAIDAVVVVVVVVAAVGHGAVSRAPGPPQQSHGRRSRRQRLR
jgi:hypothetical protein